MLILKVSGVQTLPWIFWTRTTKELITSPMSWVWLFLIMGVQDGLEYFALCGVGGSSQSLSSSLPLSSIISQYQNAIVYQLSTFLERNTAATTVTIHSEIGSASHTPLMPQKRGRR